MSLPNTEIETKIEKDLHPKIDPKDLAEPPFFLAAETRKAIFALKEKQPDLEKISRKHVKEYGLDNMVYSVIFAENSEAYTFYKKLGDGAQGNVKLCQNLRTGEWCAVKIMFLNEFENVLPEAEMNYKREKETLIKLNRFKGSLIRKDKRTAYLIQKVILGETLFRSFFDDADKHSTQQLLINYFRISIDALKALKELHDINFIHRDLCAENILWNSGKGCMLIDFSLTTNLKKSHVHYNRLLIPHTSFMPADISNKTAGFVKDKGRPIEENYIYSKSIDIYAMGDILKSAFDFLEKLIKERKDISDKVLSIIADFKMEALEPMLGQESSEMRPSINYCLQTFLKYESIFANAAVSSKENSSWILDKPSTYVQENQTRKSLETKQTKEQQLMDAFDLRDFAKIKQLLLENPRLIATKVEDRWSGPISPSGTVSSKKIILLEFAYIANMEWVAWLILKTDTENNLAIYTEQDRVKFLCIMSRKGKYRLINEMMWFRNAEFQKFLHSSCELETNAEYFRDLKPPKSRMTPLEWASYAGQTRTVQELLCGNMNLIVNNMESALSIACERGHLEVVKLLLAEGRDFHFSDVNKTSQFLYKLTDAGHLKIAHMVFICHYYYVESKAKILTKANIMDEKAKETIGGLTSHSLNYFYHLLKLTAKQGDMKILQELISLFESSESLMNVAKLLKARGVAPDIFECLLNSAAVAAQAEVMAFALKKVDEKSAPIVLKEAFRHVLKKGLLRPAYFLYKNNYVTPSLKQCRRMLFLSVKKGVVSITNQILTKHSSDLSTLLNAKNKKGQSLLEVAVKEGHDKIVDLLLKHKADVCVKTSDPEVPTVLHVAAKHGRAQIAQTLIDAKAPMESLELTNEKPSDKSLGKSPLFLAVEYNHLEVAQVLVRNGANLHKGDSVQTPLHHACGNGQIEFVQLLLDAKADPNFIVKVPLDPHKDFPTNYSALACCKMLDRNRLQVAKLLVEKGAKVGTEMVLPEWSESRFILNECYIRDKKDQVMFKLFLERGANANDFFKHMDPSKHSDLAVWTALYDQFKKTQQPTAPALPPVEQTKADPGDFKKLSISAKPPASQTVLQKKKTNDSCKVS